MQNRPKTYVGENRMRPKSGPSPQPKNLITEWKKIEKFKFWQEVQWPEKEEILPAKTKAETEREEIELDSPEREKDASGTNSGDPHDPTSPDRHRVLPIVPAFEGQPRGYIPHAQSSSEYQEPNSRNGKAYSNLQDLVDSIDPLRPVPEGVDGGWRWYRERPATQ